jgi:hypothetical protein
MPKPATLAGYSNERASHCECLLVTLLRGLGPWKHSVYLVGGLAPRYLVRSPPTGAPAHAGTLDVDIVIDLQLLADTDAYRTLEDNFRKMGFERAQNDKGQRLTWSWQTRAKDGTVLKLELLADAPDIAGGRVAPLPTAGNVSALNIPHASIVFDLYETIEVRAELIGENGIATEGIKHANLVSFTCLKAFAFDDRAERKDAHDLIYCLEHAKGGPEAAATSFRQALDGKHASVVRKALDVLRNRFAQEPSVDGYRKDGPVAVARFELGESNDVREARILRQRFASAVIDQLLARIGLKGNT